MILPFVPVLCVLFYQAAVCGGGRRASFFTSRCGFLWIDVLRRLSYER